MVRRKWGSTADALANIDAVRGFINSSAVGQPLNWTGIAPLDLQVGSACVLGRCIGVDAASAAMLRLKGGQIFPSTFPPTCGAACTPLAGYEWLALDTQWTGRTGNSSAGARIYSTTKATLKKSTAVSSALPTSMKLTVPTESPCIVENATRFSGYWLCIHQRN